MHTVGATILASGGIGADAISDAWCWFGNGWALCELFQLIAGASAFTGALLEAGLTSSWERLVTCRPDRPVTADRTLAFLAFEIA